MVISMEKIGRKEPNIWTTKNWSEKRETEVIFGAAETETAEQNCNQRLIISNSHRFYVLALV